MGATEEQMQLLDQAGIMHVSYVLILYSIAFLLFLCKSSPQTIKSRCSALLTISVVNVLLHIYAVHAWPESAQPPRTRYDDFVDEAETPDSYSRLGGGARSHHPNGHARSAAEAQQLHDAEAFELEGLISDEEDGHKVSTDGRRGRQSEDGDNSPLVRKETSR